MRWFLFLFTYLTVDKYFVAGQTSDLDSVKKMIVSQGYPYEPHEIVTADGYILTAHRIRHGRVPVCQNRGLVLIQHGIFCSSADFVVLGHGKSLAFLLADQGYDVWLGNSRGNKYSRRHEYLDPDKDDKFWDFSWHEMGVYDLPATIDYILAITGYESLSYVGHSQGTTSFFVMISERPEYNLKIRSMHAMGPLGNVKNAKTLLMRVLADTLLFENLILGDDANREFIPSTRLTKLLGQAVCERESPVQEVCANIFFLSFGFDSERLNRTNLGRVFENLPAGCSIKQIVHYGQGLHSGKFAQFDFGLIKNAAKYNQLTPPPYRLDRISIPVAFYYGENDWAADPEDVKLLAKAIPNLIELYPIDTWAHMDFLWAIGVEDLVYARLISLMNIYATTTNQCLA